MKIVYGKQLNAEEISAVNLISAECGILFDTARLLYCRGVDTVDKARAFLSPGGNGFHDPFLLDDMLKAVERIKVAKDFNENVFIFGDYDADGVSATTVLYFCLKEFGIDARKYVPEREDGYGINLDTIAKFNGQKKIDLLITVDCGISDKLKIEELKKMGIDVIVTDHHEPPEELPDCIRINPKIAGQKYPFTELCGAGVAYKLGYALIGKKANDYLDFVALATVADSMDLVGENRDIVVEGLKLFNDKNRLRLPFKYLLNTTDKQVTSQTIAYIVAPRVNAGGRMGDANCALELFTQSDENKVYDLAVKLCEYNVMRQAECDRIHREARQRIETEKLYKDGVILVGDESWNAGFIGIVAAKLVEEYSKPVIVFAGHEDYLKGSCRSVDGFNIYDAINSAKDLLIAYGGHAQAAGVSVRKENFVKLKEFLNDFYNKSGVIIDGEQKVHAEWIVNKPFSLRFAHELDALEPFGVGNRRPLFVIDVNCARSFPLKSGSPHYTFKTDIIEMLDFNGYKNVVPLSLNINKKVVFELNLSIYKNKESIKGYVRHVVSEYGDFSQVLPEVFSHELKRLIFDDKSSFKRVDKTEAFSDIRNSIYVFANPKLIKNYPEISALPISFFNTEKEGGEILISPQVIPETVKRVVCVGKPIQFPAYKSEILLLDCESGETLYEKLSTDRSDFTRVFGALSTLNGKPFHSTSTFCAEYLQEEDVYQAIFCTEVFIELGIFSVNNGVFLLDQNVKNALTNSKVYSKIYSLR